MNRFFHAGWLWSCAVLAGCSRPEAGAPLFHADPERLDAEAAFREAADLVAISPRVANTPGAERAARHLQARLAAAGIEARIDTFEDAVLSETGTFHNVIGVIPGDLPQWIILGSHFDTMGGIENFVGANDSGSSSGLLIEIGRVLRAAAEGTVSRPTFVLAFFDGEECKVRYGPRDGLHGSRHHARQLAKEGHATNVAAMILLDMVGDRDLTITLPRNAESSLLRLAFKAAEEEGVRNHFSLLDSAVLDDHVPYLNEGMPAVNLIDFHFGSGAGRNDYWHTPADTLDKISAESLGKVGRVTLRMVDHLVRDARRASGS